VTAERTKRESPPIPHEHGAWVILYAPLVIALAVARPFAPGPAFLLLLAVTGAFLARNVAGLLIRRRGERRLERWLALYLALHADGALPLFLVYRRFALLPVGLLAALLFALHARLSVWPSRRRLDRSQWGENLAVGALALTAPAAYVAARGALDGVAWCLWAACTLFFSSSIFFVKMLLAAVKVRGAFLPRDRWNIGRDNLVYHLLLAGIVMFLAARIGGWSGTLALLAYVPVIARALVGWAALSNWLPPLKRVDLAETFYSLWFTAFFLAALLAGR
jgi:hypothetical protein